MLFKVEHHNITDFRDSFGREAAISIGVSRSSDLKTRGSFLLHFSLFMSPNFWSRLSLDFEIQWISERVRARALIYFHIPINPKSPSKLDFELRGFIFSSIVIFLFQWCLFVEKIRENHGYWILNHVLSNFLGFFVQFNRSIWSWIFKKKSLVSGVGKWFGFRSVLLSSYRKRRDGGWC